jgi:GntR family transcriptional repressor for pyruvate dehydrogenase complex
LSGSFQSINRTNRSQQVRDQLEAALLRGEFKAGDRLPSERALGETFGVSRVSIREALRSLEALGMVEVKPGRGCFVADTLSNSSALLRRWIGLHSDELLDILNVHKALDGLAAAEAAAHITPATVSTLEEICAKFDKLAGAEEEPSRLERIAELDIEFHETIARASSSPLIEQLVRELNRYLLDSRLAFALRSRPAASAGEHRAILRAIADGDPAAAQAAMTEHVEIVRHELLEVGLELDEDR